MSFMDGREGGSKPGSGGAASSQNEVRTAAPPQSHGAGLLERAEHSSASCCTGSHSSCAMLASFVQRCTLSTHAQAFAHCDTDNCQERASATSGGGRHHFNRDFLRDSTNQPTLHLSVPQECRRQCLLGLAPCQAGCVCASSVTFAVLLLLRLPFLLQAIDRRRVPAQACCLSAWL